MPPFFWLLIGNCFPSSLAHIRKLMIPGVSMLHAWLASSGLGDVEYMVLRNPFIKEEDGLGEEREGDHGKGGRLLRRR